MNELFTQYLETVSSKAAMSKREPITKTTRVTGAGLDALHKAIASSAIGRGKALAAHVEGDGSMSLLYYGANDQGHTYHAVRTIDPDGRDLQKAMTGSKGAMLREYARRTRQAQEAPRAVEEIRKAIPAPEPAPDCDDRMDRVRSSLEGLRKAVSDRQSILRRPRV